jgi:hypothetical protein
VLEEPEGPALLLLLPLPFVFLMGKFLFTVPGAAGAAAPAAAVVDADDAAAAAADEPDDSISARFRLRGARPLFLDLVMIIYL